jgi:protein SCO1/2
MCGLAPAAGAAGLAVEPPKAIASMQLVDQDGSPASFPASDGRWQLVFFGYTHCADVCPMTLHKIARVLEQLGSKAERLSVAFVSLDNSRDSPQRLKEYLRQYDARVRGLTGDAERLQAVANELGVLVRRYQGKTALAYTLHHSSLIYLLDERGRARRMYAANADIGEMAAELERLLPAPSLQAPSVSAKSASAVTGAEH